MSIPPLVCNTPPPPDQCEEEKEDFDLHYTLSQEDDDESEFNFQGFSCYNQNRSISNYNERQEEICNSIPNEDVLEKPQQSEKDTEITFGDSTCKDKSKITIEEINVEDLNLCVQEETVTVTIKEDAKLVKEVIQNNEETENNVDTTNIDISKNDLNTTKIENNFLEESNSSIFIANTEIKPSVTDRDTKNDISDRNLDEECNDKEFDTDVPSICDPYTKKECEDVTDITSQINDESDNDFEDFKDFKDSNDTPTALIGNFENPWGPAEAEQQLEFSDFKANFDSIDTPNKEEGDDFEDFEEFKSSNTVETPNETKNITEEPANKVSTFNPQTQIENVNKVFNSIFESEAPIEEIVLETNLDTTLGETWRHLLDTDDRQPYMVAWNDSCGQKTLLKALCIDSRNILFAPKWNSNTPKFAANLSNAPLQPQKQSSSASDVADKQSNKPSSSWTDNFTADRKESCKTDKENAGTESRPNIEMFAPVSSKSEQIFSSTLNVQPIRQINLPDTHIFTPTDSETPRSKTIHYSSGPPILHPQSSSEPNSISVGIENAKQDSGGSEYWEFQDFKTASEANVTSQPHSTIADIKQISLPTDNTVATQILQPVKVDMLTPTLNWPNPGEIKETFDDFTDFISNTSNTERNDISSKLTTQTETSFPVITTKNVTEISPVVVIPTDISIDHITITKLSPSGENFDDFDMFQSALPPSKSQSSSDSLTAMNTMPQVPTNVDYGFFNRSDKTSSNNISNECMRPNNDLKSNQSFLEKTSLPMQTTEIPMIPSSILQPTITNSNTSNQKTGQILQPLSLESYSQINWPNPGIDLQDLSRFNPVDTLQSLKSDLSAGTQSKGASPVHNHKPVQNQPQEDDVWGEFVSSKPKQPTFPTPVVADDDEWSDFISSPNIKTQNGLNTISFNVHTNTNLQKPSNKLSKNNDSFDIPTLNYITPKSGSSKSYNIDRHLQRL